jgi:hypothetical protein
MNYWEDHLKLKIWAALPCRRKEPCGNAHADVWLLPYGGFTLVRSYSPLDILSKSKVRLNYMPPWFILKLN